MNPLAGRAQAWVPIKGEGSVSILYQHATVHDHLFADGSRADVGHIRSHSVLFDIDYGLSDRLTVSASLPYVAAAYKGPVPHVNDGHTLDDGVYHPTFQDFRLDLRYNAIELPFTITPFAAVNLPSHNYEFFAHSAVGLRLKEVQLGTYIGIVRAPLYIQGRCSYGVFERVIGHRRERTNLDAEVGWFVTPALRLFAFEIGQVSHGGVEFLRGVFPANLTAEEFQHHDQLGRANFLEIGGGVAFALHEVLDISASLLTTAAGTNGHAVKYGLTIGMSWAFGGRTSGAHSRAGSRIETRPQMSN